MSKRLFLFVFYFSLFCFDAQAEEIILLKKEADFLKIGTQTYRFDDTTGAMTLDDILKPENQAKFQRNEDDVFTSPASTTAYWFKFTFENQSQISAWLAFETNYMGYIDFYTLDSAGSYEKPILTGSMRGAKTKPYATNNYWLPLLNTGKHIYYLRTKALGVVEVPLYIGTLSSLNQERDFYDFFTAGFIGAMTIVFFYNLFLYFSTYERLYMIYLAYLFFALLAGLAFNNYPILDVLIQNHYWHRYIILWHSPLYVFIIWFVIVYLEIKRKSYRLYQAALGFLGVILLTCIASAFTSEKYYYLPYNIFQVFVFLLTILGLYIGAYFSLKKEKAARFFLAGWSFLIISTMIYLGTINSLFPYTIFTRNILYVGFLLEACLFSLALGYRFSVIKIQNVEVKQQNEALDALNEELQQNIQQVEMQKREIELQSAQLSDANQTKDRLFSIIAHDLRNPVAALRNTIDILSPDILNSEELDFIKEELGRQFSSMDFTLNNLLGWARSQMQGENVKPSRVNAYEIVINNLELFAPMLHAKQVQFQNSVPPTLHVWADLNHLRFIFRNLINNAIKFSQKESMIFISAREDANFVTFAIRDKGIGIREEKQKRLFDIQTNFSTDGTAGEKGTGLGLVLCKEFVEKNGGKIWVESEVGRGSTFYFTLLKS